MYSCWLSILLIHNKFYCKLITNMEEKIYLKETLIESDTKGTEGDIRTASVSSSVYNLINGILGNCNYLI